MPTPSKADLAAVQKLMGATPDVLQSDGTFSKVVITNTWDIVGSGRQPWHVERRYDTKNGGTYFYCPCPAWKFGGQSCKHTQRVEDTLCDDCGYIDGNHDQMVEH